MISSTFIVSRARLVSTTMRPLTGPRSPSASISRYSRSMVNVPPPRVSAMSTPPIEKTPCPKMMSPGAAISCASMSMYSHLIDVLPAPDTPVVILQSQAVVAVDRKRQTAEVDRLALQSLIRQVHQLLQRSRRTVCGRVPAIHVHDVDLGIALINRVGKSDD